MSRPYFPKYFFFDSDWGMGEITAVFEFVTVGVDDFTEDEDEDELNEAIGDSDEEGVQGVGLDEEEEEQMQEDKPSDRESESDDEIDISDTNNLVDFAADSVKRKMQGKISYLIDARSFFSINLPKNK